MNNTLFFVIICWFVVIILTAGCASPHYNPCSMNDMTASELEHALEHGCQK